MTPSTFIAAGCLALGALAGSGCAGLHSKQAAVQLYTLEPVFALAASGAATEGATVQVLRPLAAPGLDNERIALIRGAQRLDYYAASHWPGPLPDLLQPLVIDALRASGKFRAVQPDATVFAADQVLQIEIRSCQAEYAGDGPPSVHVRLLATLGRQGDRTLVANVAAESTVAAGENRMQAVVVAFQSAVGTALEQLVAQLAP